MFLGRVPAPGEATWTDSDRAWALALTVFEADQHHCGQPASESFDPDNEDAYVASGARCHACAAAARKAATFKNLDGLSISVSRENQSD